MKNDNIVTVRGIEWIDMEKNECAIRAECHESEAPRSEKTKRFRSIEGGRSHE